MTAAPPAGFARAATALRTAATTTEKMSEASFPAKALSIAIWTMPRPLA